MQKWRAILGTSAGEQLCRGGLEAGQVPEVQPDLLTVVLLSSADLETWGQSAPVGVYRNRGPKNSAKPLSNYLPHHGTCVRLEVGYRDPGQAERGLRALLDAAAKRHRSGVMLLGVGAELFEQLWVRTAQHPEGAGFAEKKEISSVNDYSMGDDLLEGHPDLEVPDSLRIEYAGSSERVERVRKLIVLAARTRFPVMIEGETGTGKEIVARQIHNLSGFAAEAFMSVNCGGIPENLFESELFGHVRGSFTGAFRDKKGFWTLASRGSLFLDEIGDLLPQHQVKVLRAIEDGKYRPVGSEVELSSRARIIVATHRDLTRLVKMGQFREDLYYRLFAMRIRTPALREHAEDIPELAELVWRKNVGGGAPRLSRDVLTCLRKYPWPGNVRELRSFLINLSLVAGARPATPVMVEALMCERNGVAVNRQQDG